MMNILRLRACVLLLLATLPSVWLSAVAQSVESSPELAIQGRDRRNDETAAAGRRPSESDRQNPGTDFRSLARVYNRAVGQYRDSNYESAADGFRSVIAAEDTALAAKARFNLGNCHYVMALEGLESEDTPDSSTIDHLETAIAEFRASLRLEPADVDARVNIELAVRLLDELQSDQSQSRQSPRTSEERSRDEQGDSNQRPKDDPRSGEPTDQSNQGPNGRPGASDPDRAEDRESEQKESDQTPSPQDRRSDESDGDTQQQTDSAPSPGQSDASPNPSDEDRPPEQPPDEPSESTRSATSADRQDAGDPADDARQSSSRSQREPGDDRGETGLSSQPDPGNAVRPEGELEATNQQSGAEESEASPASLDDVVGAMTEEEANKLLQSIRDRNMIRQLRREAARRDRYIPVERDW
jgi:Ca-activated chloride channel family protein